MPRFGRYLLLIGLLIAVIHACRTSRSGRSRAKTVQVTPPLSVTVAPEPVVVLTPPATTKPGNVVDEEADSDDAATATGAAPPKREFRAVWIATVDNIDWPSRKGLPTDMQQREFRMLLDQHRETGLNAVIVQVRAAADAFYAKSFEPWSEWLTGQQGLAPAPFYDPLEFMINEAHSRGLEFHAWLNLDRATFSKNASIAPTHISFQRPNWMVEYNGRKVFNLGLPDVRAYVAGVAANIVRQYDVDGIHFDDYFYPYAVAGQTFNDELTYRQYGVGLNRDDWRRSNVDAVIRQIGDSVRAVRPSVKFGISPFGIWKNRSNDPEGSPTNGGQAYYELYADTRKWVREGWIDYIAPQVYFSTGFNLVPYRELVDWWTKNSGTRHLYIGQGAYRLGRSTPRDTAWGQPTQLADQMRHNRRHANVVGSIFFSAKSLRDNLGKVRDTLQTNFYRYPALIPPMPWKDSIPPLPPRDLKAAATDQGVELFWQEPEPARDGQRAYYYVVYRYEGKANPRKTDDPRHMLAMCLGELTTRFVDKTARSAKRYTYVVTALDRLHNESPGVTIQHRGL